MTDFKMVFKNCSTIENIPTNGCVRGSRSKINTFVRREEVAMNKYLCVYLDEYINMNVNIVEADTEEMALDKYFNVLNDLGIQCFKNEIYITNVEDICYV